MGGEEEAAARLNELLATTEKYRRQWVRHVRRSSGDGVNQAAVAQVLAEHLWDRGEVADCQKDLPRKLKDPVSRALSGRLLSIRTLRLFVEAFDFDSHHGDELFALHCKASGDLRWVRGDEPPTPEVVTTDYTTIMLHEFHTLGADGRPVEHRTVQGIRALRELSRYRYVFDTASAAVEVVRGGCASQVYRLKDSGLYAVDILFAKPVAAGHTASFEYRTVLSYAELPEPVFRRVARRLVTNVEVHVSFHPKCVPISVLWCEWDAYDFDRCVSAEPVELDSEYCVHRFVPALNDRGIGFSWKLPC